MRPKSYMRQTIVAAIIVVLGSVFGVARPAYAACSPATEVTVEALFQGQKCVTSGKLMLNGTYKEFGSDETFQGVITRTETTDKITVTKQGEIKTPAVQGTLNTNMAFAQPGHYLPDGSYLNYSETKQGTETLVHGTFTGKTTITRKLGLRYGSGLFIEKHGTITGPTPQVIGSYSGMNGPVYTGSFDLWKSFYGDDCQGCLMYYEVGMNGTWTIGNRHFTGQLDLVNNGGTISAIDKRQEVP